MKFYLFISYIVLVIVSNYAERIHVGNLVKDATENQWRLEEDSGEDSVEFLPSSSSSKLEKLTNEVGIVGGRKLDIKEVPYQVGILRNSRYVCGGALLSNWHVITVAHCFVMSLTPGIHNVVLGTNKVAAPEATAKVLAIKIGEVSGMTINNIALLKISKVKFSSNIQPIGIVMDKYEIKPGTKVLLSGYGTTNIDNHDIGELRGANLTYISRDECAKRTNIKIAESQICTSDSDLKAPCMGDEGAPLVTTANGKIGLIGLMSSTLRPCQPFPVVYTYASKYFEWIVKNILETGF